MSVRPELRPGVGRRTRSAFAVLLGLLLAAIGVIVLNQPAAATGDTPPGADGSVKIDGEPVDGDPSNEPHVDCIFGLQYFGFDDGTNTTNVTFYGWPPTGEKVVVLPITGQTDYTFEGGRPPGNTLNHTELYELDTSGLEVHPQQGVHIKVEVTVTDAGGKVDFRKHKVFWVQECKDDEESPSPSPTKTPEDTPTPEPTDTPTVSPTETPTPSPTESETPAPVPTEFEGGASAGGTGSDGGFGSLAALGWVAVFGGLVLTSFGLLRLMKPVSLPTRGA